MQIDQTENQELILIKQFVQKYGKYILAVLLAALLIIAGTKFWQNRVQSRSAAAAQIFQDMMMAELQQNTNDATAKGEQLISDYSSTTYAPLSALLLAKIAVNAGDLDKAAERLQWVIKHRGAQKLTQNLATVRLSAVLQAQGKLDEALKLVEAEPDPAYTALYAQARGNIYAAKGDAEKAKAAYEQALRSLPPGTQAPILQMQLMDLGGDINA